MHTCFNSRHPILSPVNSLYTLQKSGANALFMGVYSFGINLYGPILHKLFIVDIVPFYWWQSLHIHLQHDFFSSIDCPVCVASSDSMLLSAVAQG